MSAKRRMLDSRESGISFVYIRNKRGPRTVPWGTPDKTGERLEERLLTCTNCLRFVRNALIQLKTCWCRLRRETFSRRREWSTLSKAFRSLETMCQLGCYGLCVGGCHAGIMRVGSRMSDLYESHAGLGEKNLQMIKSWQHERR